MTSTPSSGQVGAATGLVFYEKKSEFEIADGIGNPIAPGSDALTTTQVALLLFSYYNQINMLHYSRIDQDYFQIKQVS